MHLEEAKWIKSVLDEVPDDKLGPVFDMGSSTEDYRVREQPHIDSILFKPLRKRNIKIVHQDIKEAKGVDLVYDLMDPCFTNKLQELKCKTLLCNNLLQHVENPEILMHRVYDGLPSGALIIVTGPSRYQKHYDPIDNLFRPSPGEVVQLFGPVEVISTATLNVGTVLASFSGKPLSFVKLIARLTMPFWNLPGWLTAVHKFTWLFRKRQVYCVAVRKA